jgi:hypothetical protein
MSIGAGVVLGFLLDSSPPRTQRPDEGQSARVGPGPYDEVNGVPVGYAHTEEGAVAAAANFSLIAGRDEFLNQRRLERAMQTLAAPSWRAAASKEAQNGFTYIVDTYGDDADLSSSIMAYEVADFDPGHVSVKLWVVSVASGSKRRNVEEVWATQTIRLTWFDDWKVSDLETQVGPSPIDLPSSESRDASLPMRDFQEFRSAPVP